MNIAHYSKPNPKIKFKTLKTLKAGKSAARTTFITLPRGATLTDFKVTKASSTGLCAKSGTSVKAASNKSGTCVFTWKYKRAGSTQVITKKTAIKVIR